MNNEFLSKSECFIAVLLRYHVPLFILTVFTVSLKNPLQNCSTDPGLVYFSYMNYVLRTIKLIEGLHFDVYRITIMVRYLIYIKSDACFARYPSYVWFPHPLVICQSVSVTLSGNQDPRSKSRVSNLLRCRVRWELQRFHMCVRP